MDKTSVLDGAPLYLVTGGTGFVGAYLLRYMVQEGYRVRALRRPGSRLELTAETQAQIEWVEGNLLDPGSLEDAMEGVDTVIHCAALVSFAPADEKSLMRVNRDGTAFLVDAALDCGVRRFILVSSVAALGRQSGDELISEQTKWQRSPLATRYGVSKFLGEQEVWRGQAEGLSVAVVYPSLIMGSGWWTEGTNGMLGHVDRSLPFFPPGSNGLVDVRDVVRALLLVIERDQDGDRFLLNGANVPYKVLLDYMAAKLGRRAPRYAMPRWLAGLLILGEALRARLKNERPLLTRESIRNAFQQFGYDNRHSCEDLGLSYTPWEQTIGETAAQYREAKLKNAPYAVLPLL